MAYTLDSLGQSSGREESSLSLARAVSRRKYLSHSDLLEITEMLWLLMESNVPMAEALAGLIAQTPETASKRREILTTIYEDVQSGKPLSEAMSYFPRDFNIVYTQMIQAGEISGGLPDSLRRLHAFLDQDRKIRASFIGAMIVPSVMMLFTVAAVLVLLIGVVPRLETIFEGKENLLPAISRFMFWMSAVIRGDWPWLILGLAGMIAGGMALWKNQTVRQQLSVLFMRVPIFGQMYRETLVARVVNVLGALLNRNVPMLESLRVCSLLSTNIVYRDLWLQALERVQAGEPLSSCMSNTGVFPEFFPQIVRVGERGGNLGQVLSQFAVGLNERTLRRITNTSKLIEPIMTVFMGAVVGTIVFSFMLPILKIKDTIG